MNHSASLKSIISKTSITLSPHQSIEVALNTMTKHSISSIIIIDEQKKPVGIFTEHDGLSVIAQEINHQSPIQSVMTQEPFCVDESMLVHDAYLLMEEKKFRHLIVVDKNHAFLGVATEGDFLRHLGFESLKNNNKVVQEVMSNSPLIVDYNDTLSNAVSIMHEQNSDYAIVMKGSEPFNIITERDIIQHYSDLINKSNQKVGDIPHHEITMIDESTPLQEASKLMQTHSTHQLIVISKQKKLVGLLNRHDILRAIHGAYFEFLINLIDKKSDTINEMDRYAKTLQKEHRRVEESEAKFKALFELIPFGIYILDLDTLLPTQYNSVAHKQLGYTAEEFQSLRVMDYEAIETPEEHLAHLKKIKEEGYDLFQTQYRCKDGSLLDIEVNVAQVTILEHDYLMVVSRDISQHIQDQKEKLIQQKAFEQQSIFLRTMLNTIPDLIWLKDLDGKYLACNKNFERLFGATEEQIKGKTDFDFVNAHLAQFFRDNDLAAIKAGGSRNNEEYLIFNDGSHEGYFDTIKTPMKDKDGTNIGVLGIAHEISSLKRKEEEIEQVQKQAHIGTWEWNVAENIFIGSRESHNIFNLPEEATLSMETLLELVHEEDRQRHKEELLKILENKKFTEMVYRLQTSDGKIKWVKSFGEFFLDKENNIQKGIGFIQDITQQMEHEQKLEHLANFDTLTGLSNRTSLLRHLKTAIESSKRHNSSIALLMFDLDRFKDVNDSFGHAAGDELLKLAAQRFSSRLREGDLLARLGGDEFAIVMQKFIQPEDAGRLANEIIELLLQEYQLSSGALVHIGASAGITLYPNHGENADVLLQHADAALYKAKEEGRGTYRYYTDELTESARLRVDYETRLRRAITNQNFEVYYQPQVHIATGRILGAEALIRWREPDLGMIPPAFFIPIAEETGLINEIGEWVLNETCRQGKIWLDQGYRLTLAVNLSSNQIRHQDIPSMVTEALHINHYKAEHLELEITESALMQREEEVVLMLHQLRAMGIRLAIDDFGTGYSSLSYLKRFPIDVLKIDKSFIDDIPFENDDMAIVSAIIAMGDALGYQVLAEGTERIEQIEFLKEKGCGLYQGYYKSKPLPAAEFEKLLEENLR